MCSVCIGFPGALQKVCTWKPLRYWGNISYSYYLAHGITLKALATSLARIQPREHAVLTYFGALAVGLAASWVTASLLYLLVEKPLSLASEQRARIDVAAPASFPLWMRRDGAPAAASGKSIDCAANAAFPRHRQYHEMKAVRQHRSTEDRISVLHFTNSMLWGGVEEHICNLLGNISRDLFRAHLVCDPVLFERFRNVIPDDIDVTPLAFSSPTHVGSALRFARLLFRERVRIVHSHMFWSSLFASPIAWAGRVPVIVETLHGTEAWRTGWKASCLVDRATTGFVSKYIAVCQSDAQFLQHKKHILPKKIAIIHNGVDARRFCGPQDARNAIRRSLGFMEADVVVIMVARFHRGKGHAILLNAIRELRPLCPLLKVVCLGEGEGEPELRALSEEYGIADSVRLVGYQQNVPEWLAAADINVLPSFYEGLPLTILEAMASALPTVATNVGGIPEAIENGVTGTARTGRRCSRTGRCTFSHVA